MYVWAEGAVSVLEDPLVENIVLHAEGVLVAHVKAIRRKFLTEISA